ncbi:MAG: response regulator [Candidatus Hydrogenedentes bacterium]|nr:response regulator [Candidatus Hydrogenedentota bacterium]
MSKILSVDDSAMMRRIIKGAAAVLGYDLVEAANGAEALDVLRQMGGDICLIMLDVNMPVMDGFATLEQLKADDAIKHIPVIMVTTESERVNIIRAVKMGAANYVCKPFTQEEITTKMLETIGGDLDL